MTLLKEAKTGILFEVRAGEALISKELEGAVRLEPAGWLRLTLRSDEPVLGEPEQNKAFEYTYLLRRSGANRLLVLTGHTELLRYFFRRRFARKGLFSPEVDIGRLVRELAKGEHTYGLGAIWARVDGHGQSLRAITLYGADLGDSELFMHLLPNIAPYRATLRDVRSGVEILSANTRGQINFFYRGQTSLARADDALRYLSRHSYLNWDASLDLWTKTKQVGDEPW